jgi:glycine/D-amino acid oxidase-like deaminating enzyme
MAETGGSYWVESAQMPRYPVLDRDIDVDVVVVGAGITGLTAAYLLKRSGRCVAVIERARVGGVDSMYTTAHLTAVTDLDLTDLVSAFGRDHAQAAWDAGFAAIQQLDATVRDENISCEWTWVPGYRYQAHDSRSDRDRKRLREEAVLAEELEFDAMYLDEVPGIGRAGVAYAGQAKFHREGEHCQRNAAADEALPLHVVCGWRSAAERHRTRGVVLGHGGSLPLCPGRSACGP